MNNINEIKEMLDKLNEEFESLQAENNELKLRLLKCEGAVTNITKDDFMLEDKKMLGKLNEELESLRAENNELKLRLSKYEGAVTNSATDNLLLEDVYQTIIYKNFPTSRRLPKYHAGFIRLTNKGYKTLGDCRGLTIYDIINLPRVGASAAAMVIVALEHFGIIKVEDFWISKVEKSHSLYDHFTAEIVHFRETIKF